MSPLSDLIINSLFTPDNNGILRQKENEQIEYKEFFERENKESKAKYAKELAALYNTSGGYLVFGIKDESNSVVGLKNFEEPDSAVIVNDISEYFKPNFTYNTRVANIDGKIIFVFHVAKREGIPTVCIKDHPGILKEGTIYWRYSSQSNPIHAEDLIHLMMDLKSQDTNKLVNLKQKEMSIEHKPCIRRGISGGLDGGAQITIENKGKLLKIKSIQSLTEGIGATFTKEPPFNFVPTAHQSLRFVNLTRQQLGKYQAELIIENEIDEEFVIIFEGDGASIKMNDPIKR